MHENGAGERRTASATLGPATPMPMPARRMPGDYAISLRSKRTADRLIPQPGGERVQPMRGYADTFTDIVDFILRVTHRVWEEKAIGDLYEHCASNVRVFQDDGLAYGRDALVEATTQMIGAFPDLRCHADEIVWCGDEDSGFWTSHRFTLVGHNSGWSQWGPPTGRRIVIGVITDCHSRANQIREEFVLYNTAALVRQLGHDPIALARAIAPARGVSLEAQGGPARGAALAAPGAPARRAAPTAQGAPAGPGAGVAPAGAAARTSAPSHSALAHGATFTPVEHVGEVERLIGQGSPGRLDPGEPGIEAFVRRVLHEVFNWRLLDRIATHYAPGFRFHGPADRELYGRGDYIAFVLATLSMFPDAAHRVEDLYWIGNEREGYVVAVRWSIDGTHRGHGPYGPPTGRRVRQWGLTHLAVRDGLIVEEWTYSNEFNVLQQIHSEVHV